MSNTARKKYNLVAVVGLILNLVAMVAAIYKYRREIKAAIQKAANWVSQFSQTAESNFSVVTPTRVKSPQATRSKSVVDKKVIAPAVKAATSITSEGDLNSRQQAALSLVSKNKEVTVIDVMGVVDEQVTNRTIRRDMDKLEALGLVKQIGKTKNAIYKLV